MPKLYSFDFAMSIAKSGYKPENIASLFAISGILILVFMAFVLEIPGPEKIEIKDVEFHENQIVEIEGTVTSVYAGGMIFYVSDEEPEPASIQIFAPQTDVRVRTGDYIIVIGEVDRYEGELEIICNDNSKNAELIIVKPWDSDYIDLEDLAIEPNKYLDENVFLINVTVTSSPSTSWNTTTFRVSDGSHQIYVKTDVDSGIEIPVLLNGDLVEIKGRFEFDDYWMSYQIVMESENYGHSVKLVT